MELFFGTCGPRNRTQLHFKRLVAATEESNPGIHLETGSYLDLDVGLAARSYTTWSEAHSGARFFLNGEILTIDGEPTQRQGRSPNEQALITNLYRQHRETLWQHLDGSFCLIVGDGPTWWIGVDPAGTRSVYWWVWEDTLAFHSHLLDLAPCYPGQLKESWADIGNFLACGSFSPGATGIRDLFHLSSGCYLVFENGSAHSEEHFNMVSRYRSPSTSHSTLTTDLGDRIAQSVQVCWQAARCPVVPLSGGLDSRFIAAQLVQEVASRDQIKTITWGEDRLRESSDAEFASQVANALGIENTWYEKPQAHLETTWDRALYLSSGEADAVIHYPEDHLLHQKLVDEMGFASMFRGDQVLGRNATLLTPRAVLAANDVCHLALLADRYEEYLAPDVLHPMVLAQTETLTNFLSQLQSPTPTGRRDEAYYNFRFRQVMAVFNRIKHADLEVYNPLVARSVLDWIKDVPDSMRMDRALLREALALKFPRVAAIPFAKRNNLPSWEHRFSHNPALARFYADLCTQPGWLDTIGATSQVRTALQGMEAGTAPAADASTQDNRQVQEAQWRRWMKKNVKRTIPGQVVREMLAERRFAARTPQYLLLCRLVVLHVLLGRIASRSARWQTLISS